jgi:hypothetical protein
MGSTFSRNREDVEGPDNAGDLEAEDCANQASDTELDSSSSNLHDRRVSSIDHTSLGASIDPSAMVRNSSAFNAASVHMLATVCTWGRRVYGGIINPLNKVKVMFKGAIEKLKNVRVKELQDAMINFARIKSKQLAQWCRENPRTAIFIGVALTVTTIFGTMAPLMLGAVGFSAAGPVAGVCFLLYRLRVRFRSRLVSTC